MTKLKFGIAVSKFNSEITANLLKGAEYALAPEQLNKDLSVKIIEVPGAFELPLAAKWLADDGVDGIIALGAIIKGETSHDEYIATACTNGLMQLSLETGLPVGYGVITADNLEQARARSSMDFIRSSNKGKQEAQQTQQSNKGYEAAQAVLEMLLAKELTKLAGSKERGKKKP